MQSARSHQQITSILDGPNALSQVTTFVALQEELLREKDRAVEAQENMQNQAKSHAQNIAATKHELMVVKDELKVSQERCQLLQNILMQREKQIKQLDQIIKLQKNEIREQVNEADSQFIEHDRVSSSQEIIKIIQTSLSQNRTLIERQLGQLGLRVQSVNEQHKSILSQCLSELRLHTLNESRRIDKEQKQESKREETIILKNRIQELETQLEIVKNSRQLKDVSLVQISQLAIQKLKHCLSKAEQERDEVLLQNRQLKTSFNQLQRKMNKQCATVQQFFEPSITSSSKSLSLPDPQLRAFQNDYQRVRYQMIRAKQNRKQDYSEMIRCFKERQSHKKRLR